ncbi:extracellular catalytic domain type 1 short-chain-length polyhydroxyalkanoate depolymerase [Streptomyces sparsogenes]|uniref:Poly(3-hydroxyalkanoate) depolymerase C n=1 Tax=Streptomyces sparsogenes DSM 40356 TaxID=1331668 RepID=A0A1R1S7C3_9ACTN|nr:PHB depolymerase family esterase [Streptomyces sparsogenes]OMI34170.1 Poly(3-hydroxyalkanoate) depolymerase C [Streptomyces sparsogenes DSM 40356]
MAKTRAATALLALLTALAAVLLPAPAAQAASVQEVTGFGTNPGALKMYRYIPEGLPAGRPVVVAMHGCQQNAPAYGTQSGWTQLADRWGFSLVLPGQTTANNISSCFNWFQSGDIARGQGEAESIKQMVDRQLADTGADRSRVYATGLSAGGGMATVLMAAYPDRFTAGGVVAGLPYGCAQAAGSPYTCMYVGATQTAAQWGNRVRAAAPTGYAGPWPRLIAFQGTADYTVKPVNMTDLVAQWTDVQGADRTADTEDTVGGYPHKIYTNPSGAPVVETYSITGMGHGQPVDPGTGPAQCGTAAAYVLDVNLCAAYQVGHAWGLG